MFLDLQIKQKISTYSQKVSILDIADTCIVGGWLTNFKVQAEVAYFERIFTTISVEMDGKQMRYQLEGKPY